MAKRISAIDVEVIRSTVAGLVDEYHLPGVAVGVVSGPDLVYAEGFGFADVEGRRHQDPTLRQRIGSITKTMVALCAMALVDEGRLSLNDRVQERLPNLTLRGSGDTLAVRHLLTHTGGIGEAPTMAAFADPWDGALWSDSPTSQIIPDAYPEGILVEVKPGTKWAYANHGFALLGAIVSRIEGEPIEDVLRRRVFDPLNMADTDCLDQPHSDLTTGYHRPPGHDEIGAREILGLDVPKEETVDGHNIRGRYRYVIPRAAGAVQSTIPDMGRYASALLARGGGIVRPSTFDLMTSPHWCPDERLVSLGLAFNRRPRFGRRTYGHGGGVTGGWNTSLSVIPEDNLAVLVHCNLNFDGFSQVEGRIVRAVLDAPQPVAADHPTGPALLQAAVGVYEPAAGHLTNFRTTRGTGRVQISAKEDKLVVRSRHGPWRNGVTMVPADPSDPAFFVLKTGGLELPGLTLVMGEGGRVTGIRFDRLVEMYRNHDLRPWA